MQICKSKKCTGCGVCADACPKQCISIKHDEQGFYKSYIDDSRCVNCHHCKKVCPANYPNNSLSIQKAYKARRTDKQAAAHSTSGGIAAALSEYVIGIGGVVAGCGFDDVFCLKHRLASTTDELEGFKGSKYLQSYTVGIYRRVREQLRTDKSVLFVGTPCQVSALKNYLGKEYDNLYTIDFVCHGVPSQYVFDKYLDSLGQPGIPASIKFRNKAHGYRNKKACFEIQIVYPEKKVRNTTEKGLYYWFASSLSIRESCYNCPFISTKRVADITLADYIGNDLNDADDEIGVNTVFVNSNKGNTLMELSKRELVMEPKNVNRMVKQYDHLMVKSYKPRCRKEFFRELPACNYLLLEQKYDAQKILPGKMRRRYYAMKRRVRKLFIR